MQPCSRSDKIPRLPKCSAICLTGGWLWQRADNLGPDGITFTPVSQTQPTEQQLADLAFAWRCVKHVKSNAITIAKEQRLLGMGSGQPNRVKSVQIALEKASQDVEVCYTHALVAAEQLGAEHAGSACFMMSGS